MKTLRWLVAPLIALGITLGLAQEKKAGDEALGTRSYDNYERPKACGSACHVDYYQQWSQAMMSQAYTHH